MQSTIQYDECACVQWVGIHHLSSIAPAMIVSGGTAFPSVNFAGSYQLALQCYKQIHRWFPDSGNCPKFLLRLCGDLRLKDVQEYPLKLRTSERLRDR